MLLPDPLAPVRNALTGQLQAAFGVDRLPGEQYSEPAGDPGLFGPDSAVWRVHADPAVIVGGVSALLLQTLHPLAMAGVADHSDFRRRPLHRLSRTASFVAGTTYGSTPVAEHLIATVRAVHRHVEGTAPDGRPYRASDPDLLRWVHVAEVSQFLRAHRRYNPWPIGARGQDRYFAEVAEVARRLGATEVPTDRAEVRAYLRSVRPELQAGSQALEAVRFVLSPPSVGDAAFRAVYAVVAQAAVGLLPGWARQLLHLSQPPLAEPFVVRPATGALLGTLRALGSSPALAEARLRVAAPAA